MNRRGAGARRRSNPAYCLASLDGDLALYEISTMRLAIDRQTWFDTVFGTFFMACGICALFLASAGLFGGMSFAVTLRTREMDVRSALACVSVVASFLPARRMTTIDPVLALVSG